MVTYLQFNKIVTVLSKTLISMDERSNISTDQSEVDNNLGTYPRIQLSLEFKCDQNTSSQRQMCDDLWRLVEQHPELEKIEKKGWSDSPGTPKGSSEIAPEKPKLPCDSLKQLQERHSYITMPKMNCCEDNKCLLGDKLISEESVTKLHEDLNEYDSRIVPLQCCPPKIANKSNTTLPKITK